MSLPACYRCDRQPCECADGITLYHGDCREILPLLEKGSVDLVLGDPPYGIGYDASKSSQQGIQPFEKIEGEDDLFDPSPWLAFPDCILWGVNNYCHAIPPRQGQWYFWDKVLRNGLGVRVAEGEFAWHRRGTKPRAFRHLWSGAYRESESGERSQHPHQKPLVLMKWCIGLADNPQVILDPFAGSGTTLRAAKDLGRKAIGIEIEEKYCRIAANRLRQEVLAFPPDLG